jgi:hypothetical protein
VECQKRPGCLADHIGHTVTVKGVVSNIAMHKMKEEAKDAATGAGIKKAASLEEFLQKGLLIH